jgi:radical SAM/Cys-rich protein
MLGYAFDQTLADHGLGSLHRITPRTLQVNVGKRCNQVCRHCHVNAGPTRTEMMNGDTVARILWLIEHSESIATVDITGGAPELNPHFRALVSGARALGRHVLDRCNLTVLTLPSQEDTAMFLAKEKVEVVASLPCYGAKNVDQQRGRGVFEDSLNGLRQLNALGYGQVDTGLTLNLVYNPVGAFLPPEQSTLETDYKRRLKDDFGVVFNQLFTITNMPIERFAKDLERSDELHSYMDLLVANFNPAAVDNLMCRDLISVDHTGRIFDCDFNQMLNMPARVPFGTIWDTDDLSAANKQAIATARHCFACTAGAGSSCGGALA